MERRRFLLTSLAGAVAAPLTTWAQAPARVTVLSPGSPVPHDDLGTAKALGLTIPPSLLARADQVI